MRESWWRVLAAVAVFAVVALEGVLLRDDNSPLDTMDDATHQWALHNRNGFFTWGAKLIEYLTEPILATVLAILIGAFFIWRDRGLKRGVTIIATVLIAQAIAQVLRVFVDRPRPPASSRLISLSDAPSYPSLHSTGSTAFMVIIAWVATAYSVKLWMRLALDAAAIATGFVTSSRVYIGAGWASDQIAAVLIALACALLVTAVIELVWPWAHTLFPNSVARWFNDDSDRRRPALDLADGPAEG
ncbi:phosphatase PAP2 family protein [Jongsikchunia kroppenstedtii]|uniref:phosphatase PAP2 family protein n=1 Tax=Jongsikchunia kroppenstedtii TaxID=1121721 RepID=UPI00037ADE2A|nr:phosphatase PAP2 family protein [Jongsikchunia kroppenstedtii]